MVSMGHAAPPRLAMMVTIMISCSSLLWSGTSSCSNFAAQAFIPPVGPISGRIVFSSDAFLAMRSSNDETGERTTAYHPPPLAFLDDRYADLFRVKKEPTSAWGAILGRLHNRHKPSAKSADIKHKHDQVTPSHLSSRSRSPPIPKLDPETGRYVVQKPATLPSASASSSLDVSKPASKATLAQVGVELKDREGGASSESSLATAAASTELKNVTQESVIAHSFNPKGDDTADDATTSVADTCNSSTISSDPPSTSHHGGAGPESSSSQHSIVRRDNVSDYHLSKKQESKGESQEHQITADLLDVVGRAFAGESSTDDDGHIATVTVDMSSSARSDDTKSNDAYPDDDATKAESDTSLQTLSIAAQDLVHPDNEDDTSNLPDAPSVVDNDNTSPEDTKIPIATLASTTDPDISRVNLPIDCAVTKDSDASPTHEEDIPQVAVTTSLEGQHPTTLSEQGVRVVKSAAEAATKIAFFVGKAALTLAVAVAKAALALDEERNIADPAPRIDVDELDRDATEALEMAENALSRSSNQGRRSVLFGSQQSSGREARRTRDFFFGLFGWLNIAKLAEMTSPSGQVSASTSTTLIMPHPPSPPSTLEALKSLEASVSKEILTSVDDAPSRNQLHQDEQKEEETKPTMETMISEKARKRRITSIEISSAIKKARDAAAKASREAEELESMLLGLGK